MDYKIISSHVVGTVFHTKHLKNKESPHLYEGPEFSIGILYGDINSTDL